MKQDILTTIFGDTSIGTMIGYLVLVFVGHIFQLVLQATNRDAQSARTPIKFSWTFLMVDNAWQTVKSGVATIILVFVAIRFAPQVLNTPISPFVAIGIGFGLSKLMGKAQNLIPDLSEKLGVTNAPVPKDDTEIAADLPKVIVENVPKLAVRFPTTAEVIVYAQTSRQFGNELRLPSPDECIAYSNTSAMLPV